MAIFFITKYALTKGIYTQNLELRTSGKTTYVYDGWSHFDIGKDAHTTAEAAVARAKEMQAKKTASLKKQLADNEKKTFTVEGIKPK